jgi:hypothetical protein
MRCNKIELQLKLLSATHWITPPNFKTLQETQIKEIDQRKKKKFTHLIQELNFFLQFWVFNSKQAERRIGSWYNLKIDEKSVSNFNHDTKKIKLIWNKKQGQTSKNFQNMFFYTNTIIVYDDHTTKMMKEQGILLITSKHKKKHNTVIIKNKHVFFFWWELRERNMVPISYQKMERRQSWSWVQRWYIFLVQSYLLKAN